MRREQDTTMSHVGMYVCLREQGETDRQDCNGLYVCRLSQQSPFMLDYVELGTEFWSIYNGLILFKTCRLYSAYQSLADMFVTTFSILI